VTDPEGRTAARRSRRSWPQVEDLLGNMFRSHPDFTREDSPALRDAYYRKGLPDNRKRESLDLNCECRSADGFPWRRFIEFCAMNLMDNPNVGGIGEQLPRDINELESGRSKRSSSTRLPQMR